MSKILVTGGAGFIGSNLTEALLQRGHFVRVLDDFSTGKRENLLFDKAYPSLEIIEGDIRDLRMCQKAAEGMEYVFHQGALPSVQRSVEDPETSNAVNVGGTLNILLAAREKGAKRVMYAASSSVYGDTPTLPKHEEMPPNPLSPYALQKYIGEQYCRLFYQGTWFESLMIFQLARVRTWFLIKPILLLRLSKETFVTSIACQKAAEGMEYVFHQCALPSVQRSVEDPETSNAVNVGVTLNILLAASEKVAKRVMYAASSSFYSDTPTLPKH